MQVRGELAWLFAGSGARIGCCTGGSDPRAERAALAAGLDIVVGHAGAARRASPARGAPDAGTWPAWCWTRRTRCSAPTSAPSSRRCWTRCRRAADADVLGHGERRRSSSWRGGSSAMRCGSSSARRAGSSCRGWRWRGRTARRRWSTCSGCTRRGRRSSSARGASRRGRWPGGWRRAGFAVAALSGAMSQAGRNAALAALREGRARVCVATDLAARGFDLPGLDLVLHAELPGSAEVLLHRSGRTGRAGRPRAGGAGGDAAASGGGRRRWRRGRGWRSPGCRRPTGPRSPARDLERMLADGGGRAGARGGRRGGAAAGGAWRRSGSPPPTGGSGRRCGRRRAR